MIKNTILLAVLAVAATLGSCAVTQQIVPTQKGTYRFYAVGSQPTQVEYCVVEGNKPVCKEVKAVYE